MKQSISVLVIGPAATARGGVSSVIASYRRSGLWSRYNCKQIETYRDGSRAARLKTALAGYWRTLWSVPVYSLIHIHLAGESSLLRKLPIIAWARIWRKPVITHVHASSEHSLFEKTPGWAVRFVVQSSTRMIALSPRWRATIQKHFPASSVECIPNPATLPETLESNKTSRPTIVFTGKLETRKGYHDLIHAARSVLKEFPQAQFLFAGHGQIAEAERLAANLGISSSVHCLGWVSNETLDPLLRNATVFCLPSYDEGVPMSVLEAMSYGLPTVTTPVGGIPDVVTHEQNGILVPPGNVTQLANALLLLLRNEGGLQERLGRAARHTVTELCSMSIVEYSIEKLYTSLAVLPGEENLSPSFRI